MVSSFGGLPMRSLQRAGEQFERQTPGMRVNVFWT